LKLLLPASSIPVIGDTLAQFWKNYLTQDFLTTKQLPNYDLALSEHARLVGRARQHSSGRLIIPIGHSTYEGTRVARSYIYLHRYLMEVAIGGYLPRQVKVTMADGDNLNCHPDNLILHRTKDIRCKYATARATCSRCGRELPYRSRNKKCLMCRMVNMFKVNVSLDGIAKHEFVQTRIKEAGVLFLEQISTSTAEDYMRELILLGYEEPLTILLALINTTMEGLAQCDVGLNERENELAKTAFLAGISLRWDEALAIVRAVVSSSQPVVIS